MHVQIVTKNNDKPVSMNNSLQYCSIWWHWVLLICTVNHSPGLLHCTLIRRFFCSDNNNNNNNIKVLQPGTPGRPRLFAISALCSALHNTWDQRLYVPSEGRSNGKVSCLKDHVSRLGIQTHILLIGNTCPEFEFGALNRSGTKSS